MIGEILRWVLANVNVELAIVIWKRAGKPFWITLLVMECLGVGTVLTPYSIFSILFWIWKQAFNALRKVNFLQKEYGAFRKSINLNSKIFFSNIKRFLGKHKGLLLFVVNLIPATPLGLFLFNLAIPLPYFTLATILVAKGAKIRYGILYILTGNFLKILIEVCGIYMV